MTERRHRPDYFKQASKGLFRAIGWTARLLWRGILHCYNLPPIDKFTFVLAIVAVLQLYAFVESQRAFLSVDDISIIGGLPHPGEPTRVLMDIRNSGHSTASVEDGTMVISFGALPGTPHYAPASVVSIPPIPENVVEKVGFNFGLQNQFTPEVLARITNGSQRLSLFGYVRYRDEFSGVFGTRTIGYCFMYDHLPTTGIPFDTCPEHPYTYVR